MDELVLLRNNDSINDIPCYVCTVGGYFHQHRVIRPEGYPDFHWLRTMSGKGQLVIKNRQYFLEENTAFLLNPNIPHEYQPVSSMWETRWITFNGKGVQDMLKGMGFDDFELFEGPVITKTDEIIIDVFNSAKKDSINKTYQCSVLLYAFLMELVSHQGKNNDTDNTSTGHIKLKPVISFINNNFMKSIPLDEMSQLIRVTPQHLCRLFKLTFNTTVFSYIRDIRLQKAKEMLLTSNLAVKHIASDVGYSDCSYFCSVFHRSESMTPLEYRNRYKL